MFYNARWYDSATGRFAQADSIVPNQYNSQNLDRFGYVLNNPLRYSDPSGHVDCDGENNVDGCQKVTTKDLSKLIKVEYGWTLKGKWSRRSIEKLLNYASDFATDVFNVTGKNGTTWIRNHLGNATLWMGKVTDWILANVRTGGTEAMVPTYSDVLLSSSGFSEHNFIHEMGHVLDNNVKNGLLPATFNGGGAADTMVFALGGNPWGCFPRFQCRNMNNLQPYGPGWYINKIAGDFPWDISVNQYADTGVAEDFAETFAYALSGNFVPSGRQDWMISFLVQLP
jgi:hypothetical protein